MTEATDKILEDFKRLAPGYYTERDGGDWYLVTPEGDRIAEGFAKRDDARRLVCWLAGEDLPKGWVIDGGNDLSFNVAIPKQTAATIWTRECRQHFPNRFDEMEVAAPKP
jgi:hypothetical protein